MNACTHLKVNDPELFLTACKDLLYFHINLTDALSKHTGCRF